MCQSGDDVLWKHLEIYLQECAKFELHYSAVRSGVVTFLLLITVTFGTQSALRVDSPRAAIAAGLGVAFLLALAYFFGLHFQRNTKAARFAQVWVGRTLAAYCENPADGNAKAEALKILKHQAPAMLIRNFVDAKSKSGEPPAETPSEIKKAKHKPGELISIMTLMGGIVIFVVFVAMLAFKVSDVPGPYISTKDERVFEFDGPVKISGDWTEIVLLQKGVRKVIL